MKWWRIMKRDADLERELRSDLELEEEEQRDNGTSPEEDSVPTERTPVIVTKRSSGGMQARSAQRFGGRYRYL